MQRNFRSNNHIFLSNLGLLNRAAFLLLLVDDFRNMAMAASKTKEDGSRTEIERGGGGKRQGSESIDT